MNAIPVKELKDGIYFTDDVYLDQNFLLLTKEIPVTNAFIKALMDWEVKSVYSEGELTDTEVTEPAESEEITRELEKDRDKNKTAFDFEEEKVSDPVMKGILDFYKYVETVYNHYSVKKNLSPQEISDKARDFCEFVKNNKTKVLSLVAFPPEAFKNYLASHSVRSTIFSIVIGLQLKFPNHKLIELTVSAMLHEIGMVCLPQQFFMSRRALTPQEKKMLAAHPVLSYNILREASFPVSVCLAAIEHHERMNGGGYPRNLDGSKISVYARIIAVACSFEAITSSRPYREGKDSHLGVMDIMRNSGKLYDESVVKALVYAISIYPIGLYVLLSNGKIGQVVDVNLILPKYPIVKVLGETDASGKSRVIPTTEIGVHIERPLTKQEWENIKASGNINR